MNSAVLTGGLEQLAAAIVGAAFLVVWIGAESGNGWTRWRVAAFFLLWQTFTPIRPWYLDLPLLLLATWGMEAAYRYALARRKVRAPE